MDGDVSLISVLIEKEEPELCVSAQAPAILVLRKVGGL
jgi:hypothetical protein